MVEEKVFLKVLPLRGTMRFGKKSKLIPTDIWPYEVLERIRTVAYRLALPSNLEGPVHPVFYVFMLRKYLPDLPHVIQLQEVQFSEALT